MPPSRLSHPACDLSSCQRASTDPCLRQPRASLPGSGPTQSQTLSLHIATQWLTSLARRRRLAAPSCGAASSVRQRCRRRSAAPRWRPPAAFVESARLAREACKLLPLTAAGRPALQAGATLQGQLLLALAKLAKAELLCPAPMEPVASHGTTWGHMQSTFACPAVNIQSWRGLC